MSGTVFVYIRECACYGVIFPSRIKTIVNCERKGMPPRSLYQRENCGTNNPHIDAVSWETVALNVKCFRPGTSRVSLCSFPHLLCPLPCMVHSTTTTDHAAISVFRMTYDLTGVKIDLDDSKFSDLKCRNNARYWLQVTFSQRQIVPSSLPPLPPFDRK